MQNKAIHLFIIGCVLSTASFAQTLKDATIKVGDSVVLKKAFADEKPAEFRGGIDGWRRYLEQNLHYPPKAQRKKIQGVIRVGTRKGEKPLLRQFCHVCHFKQVRSNFGV